MSFKETEVGRILKEWELYELKDKVNIIMGQSPKSEFYNNNHEGIPFMQGRTTFGDKYHTIDTWCTDPKKYAKQNDVLMSVRAPVGDVNIATTDLCIGRGLASLAMKNGNNEFLYYLLKNYINVIMSKGSGTVFSSINKIGIETLKLPFPSDEEQKAIAKILSDLDNKIEVNNKINKRLEDMAQSIFKHWFVDFEFPNEEGKPYKSSGGEMVESELGMIPKGWEVGVFRNYITDILGGDWGKEQPQANYIKDVYCVRGADIPEINKGNKGKSPVRFILEKNFNNKKLTEGDLIVEISGGSPTQSTGRMAYINKAVLDKFDKGLVCTNFCRAITLKNRNLMEFVYIYWAYLYDLDVFFQFENGTTGIKNLDINNFLDKNSIINPPNEMIEKFYKTVNNLFVMIQKNGKENQKLSNLRDTILPKLMSGEIRVPIDK